MSSGEALFFSRQQSDIFLDNVQPKTVTNELRAEMTRISGKEGYWSRVGPLDQL
jgi:hypothetical protein